MPTNPVTIRDAIAQASEKLREEGISNPELDVRVLLEHVLGESREVLVGNPDRKLRKNDIRFFDSLIERRGNREPVSSILQSKEFWSIVFKTTNDTLDPRPDSETIISAVLNNFPRNGEALRILDLGTGTGCLLLALLSEYPNATGVGIDISSQALEVAMQNRELLEFSERANFLKGDWCNNLKHRYDVIICNPPYIKSNDVEALQDEVKNFDPHLALDGGKSGLDCYHKIIPSIKGNLTKDGVAVFEVGKGQDQDIAEIAEANGFTVKSVEKDIAGINRCVVLQ